MNELELRAVLRGDPTAVRAFVREFGPVFQAVLHRCVLGSLRERHEDALQEIMVSLFANDARALRAWKPDKGRSLRNFLAVYAEQRAIDWVRRQLRTAREQPTADQTLQDKVESTAEPSGNESPDWVAPLFARYQAEFSPEEQRLLELSYDEELSVREIAARLGISEDAVYQRRHRLKQRLLRMKEELSKKGRS